MPRHFLRSAFLALIAAFALPVALPVALVALVPSATMAQDTGPDLAPPLVREKAYYVPFEKIEEVFEKTGRGIFLPYEEFLALWEKAQAKPPTTDDGPPAVAVVRGGTYEGTVEGDAARFVVHYQLQALKKGWSAVQLPLRGVAVETVDISDDRALFSAEGDGYTIYLPGAGAYEVKLTLSVGITQATGTKSIAFGIPPTAMSRIELSIPEDELRVDVTPGLAVTQTITEGDRTKVLALLGNSSEVTVKWMPPVGKVTEDGAIFYAQQWIRSHLGERILKVASDIQFTVLRGDVDTIRIRMPADTRLLSVVGDNISQWSPGDDGILTVNLHAPMPKDYRLSVSFERILEQTPATLSVPFPRVEDVLKEEGWAVLSQDQGLQVRVSGTQGLSQLDPESIPGVLRQTPIRVGFRYLAQPLDLDLAITRITPMVRSQTTSVVSLGKEEDRWFGWVDYQITKAGLFQLELQVPAGWTVDQMGTPDMVEEFLVADAAGSQRSITVSLKSRAFGNVRLPFRLVREGTARSGELDLGAPRVVGSTQDRGLLGVSAPRSLDVVTVTRTNVFDANVDELFRSGIMGQLSGDSAIPRAYRYREHPAAVKLRLDEKKTEIDVIAQHLVEVADGEIRSTHLLDYNILYAPVDSVRFRAPSHLDDRLQVEAKQKTQVRQVSSEGGLTLWEVSLQPPILGSLTLTVLHSSELGGLVAGQPVAPVIPLVHAAGVRSEQGFVAIRKEGTLEIVPQVKDMEAIDASDLPAKLRRGQIYSAYRYFTATPALTLGLTRYDYEELATTVVPLMHLKSILSPERRLRTRAWLWVQNSERQYLEVRFTPTTKIISLAVSGQKQRERRKKDGDATLIQIPRSAGAGGFWVELEYEEALATSTMGSFGGLDVTAPRIDGVPVQRVELELHVPNEYAYLGWSGNLHLREPVGGNLWTRFRQLVRAAEAPAATRGAPAAAVQQPITPPANYRMLRFESLAPDGQLGGYYIGWRLYWFLDFLAFLAGIVGTVMLFQQRPNDRLADGAAVLAGTLILSGFTGALLSSLLFSSFLGAGIICAGAALRKGAGSWRDYRASRLAMAPDPFLEEAEPAPVAAGVKSKPESGVASRDEASPDEKPADTEKADASTKAPSEAKATSDTPPDETPEKAPSRRKTKTTKKKNRRSKKDE